MNKVSKNRVFISTALPGEDTDCDVLSTSLMGFQTVINGQLCCSLSPPLLHCQKLTPRVLLMASPASLKVSLSNSASTQDSPFSRWDPWGSPYSVYLCCTTSWTKVLLSIFLCNAYIYLMIMMLHCGFSDQSRKCFLLLLIRRKKGSA